MSRADPFPRALSFGAVELLMASLGDPYSREHRLKKAMAPKANAAVKNWQLVSCLDIRNNTTKNRRLT